MSNYLEMTVGELVTEKPSRARFFEKIGIDYCCGGKKLLSVACNEAKRDSIVVNAALEEFDQVAPLSVEPDLKTIPIGELIDHIVAKHHSYLREELPRLSHLVEKVDNRHGENHHELKELHKLYDVFDKTLMEHMLSEENELFPAVKKMVANSDHNKNSETTRHEIQTLIHDHTVVGAELANIRKLTNDFLPPPDACNSYRAMLEGLEALERDLHVHIHKENNILFPRIIACFTSEAVSKPQQK